MSKNTKRVYEIIMQVMLDLADDTPEVAQKVIEDKINAGEHFSICNVFSVRPIPQKELSLEKDGDPSCMVPECGSLASWFLPQGQRLCLHHYNMLKNPTTDKESADKRDDVIRRTRSTPRQKEEDLSGHRMYPIGKLTRYYGQHAEDLDVLWEAFRRYVDQDAQEHGRVATPEQVENVMNEEVQRVVAEKNNSCFVQRLTTAAKANTEMQLHCGKHGEVMAFNAGNDNLHCPECYNESLQEIETSSFKQHIDKIYKLPRDHFRVGGDQKGEYAILQVRVAKPLADYLEKCGYDALMYGCSIASKKEDTDEG